MGNTSKETIRVSSRKRPSLKMRGCGCNAKRVAKHQPGWLLSYPNNDGSFDLDQQDSSEEAGGKNVLVPSLQSLSLEVLAQSMPQYIEDLGTERMHYLMSLFPACTIATLSRLCSSFQTLDIDTIAVLTGHSQVEGLSLHVQHSRSDTACLDDVLLSKAGDPSRKKTRYDEQQVCEFLEERKRNEALKTGLKRLELTNLSFSTEAMKRLLRMNPSITHLSISNSSLADTSNCDVNPLLAISTELSNLCVLDLSHCDWVTDTILRESLRKLANRGSRLDMINIAGCPNVSESACLELNQAFRGQPLISNKVY